MMDMKASISLSNTHATAPKTEAPRKDDSNKRSDAADFDRQLAQQIEQVEAEKKSAESSKSEENHIDGNNSKSQKHAEAEAEADRIDTQLVANEWLTDIGDTASEIAEITVEKVDQSLLILQTDEQLMPLAGNVLPAEMQTKVQIEGVANKNQPIQTNLNLASGHAQQKQLSLADVLAENTEDKSVSVEFKAEIKTQPGNNNSSARAGLNMATLSAAMASAQQYVPQASSSAVINMPSATAVDGFTSPLPASSGISTAVQSPNWSQGLTERVSWMMQGNMQVAELKLNPAHLGPLEIKLSIQDDKASIVFVTAHAQVKEAIDTAMPRLREMLEQQGLSLDNVDVSQYSDTKEEQANNEHKENMDATNASDSEQPMTASTQSLINIDVSQGLSIYV